MIEKIEFNYSQITEFIYLGSDLCCQEYFDDDLVPKNVTAAISLEGEKTDHIRGLDYFLWLSVMDMHAPSPEQIVLGVNTLKYFQDLGVKTYVHCRYGHGRSVTLVIAYLISTGKSYEEAYEAVHSKRPDICPTTVQINAIKEYERVSSTSG